MASYIPPSKVKGLAEDIVTKMDMAVDQILDNDEATYIKALANPFHPDAAGVRIPSLNPVDTYTNTQFDSFSISSTGMTANGKIILIFNPTAIRPRPVLIVDDKGGVFSALNSPAPLVKTLRQYRYNGVD